MGDGIAFQIGSLVVHWYGVIIAAAVLLAIFLATRLCRYRGLTVDHIFDFALLALPFGIVGARIYYVVFEWESYAGNWASIFEIWNGGMAIYGAIIGGVIAALIFCKWRKVNLLALLDVAAPVVILAQAIGRWGNFVNQEAFGNPVTNPTWQFFPAAVYIEDLAGWYQATFFYESALNLLAFTVMMLWFFGVGWFGKLNARWADRHNIDCPCPRRAMPQGTIVWAYFLLYGINRAIVEPLRSDSLFLFGTGIRVSFLLSLIMVLVAAVMLYRGWQSGRMAPQTAAAPGKKADGSAEACDCGDACGCGCSCDETVECSCGCSCDETAECCCGCDDACGCSSAESCECGCDDACESNCAEACQCAESCGCACSEETGAECGCACETAGDSGEPA